MPLLERLKDAVGVGDQDVTYNYHCRECNTKFETEEARIKDATCPNCGASGSRDLVRM